MQHPERLMSLSPIQLEGMLLSFSSHWHFLWLIAASLLAGIINAMAGGGSFLSFPALLGLGVPPIEANATNTVALWPGQITSLAALHGDVRRNLLPVVISTSVVGGILGAEILLHTRQLTFLHLIPWLLLMGSMIFWVSGPVSRWIRTRAASSKAMARGEAKISSLALFSALLPVCFYIGYFGAGGGFLIMTVLALLGMDKMHELNAMKVVAACVSNLCAIFMFIFSGRVLWHYCIISMVFAGAGGYLGAQYARRMNGEVLRAVVVITGVSIAAYFFWRQH